MFLLRIYTYQLKYFLNYYILLFLYVLLIKYQIDNSIFDKDIVLTIIYAEFIKEIFGSDENLKTNIDSKELKLKQFTKEIENNPSLIVNLSNDRLDKLISYYERITSEKQNKIEKLKISLNNEV